MVILIGLRTRDGNTEAHQKYKHKWHLGQLSCQNYNRNNQKLPQVKYRRSILSSSIHPPYYQQSISTILFLIHCLVLCIIPVEQHVNLLCNTTQRDTIIQVDFVILEQEQEDIPLVCQSPVKLWSAVWPRQNMLLLLDMISTNVIGTFLILTRIFTIGKIWLT